MIEIPVSFLAMGPRGLERRLEQLVEGTFARVFRSGLRPVEVGRRLVRELSDGRSVDVRGRVVVPNHFTVRLSKTDHEEFADIHDSLCHELAETAREHAREEGYVFMGPVGVDLAVDPRMRTGAFAIDARLREGRGGTGAGSLLLPTGERLELDEHTVTIGRMPNSTIVLADPNVSRNHAEIRTHGTGWVLVDLGSTNGSRVNGGRIASHELHDGDELQFGNTRIRFEAS